MSDQEPKQSRVKEPDAPPKPEQVGVTPPPPTNLPSKAEPLPEPDQAVVEVNEAVKFAKQFMEVGAPLQDGIPANPQAELAKARKAKKGE